MSSQSVRVLLGLVVAATGIAPLLVLASPAQAAPPPPVLRESQVPVAGFKLGVTVAPGVRRLDAVLSSPGLADVARTIDLGAAPFPGARISVELGAREIGRVYTYDVRAVDETGQQSAPLTVSGVPTPYPSIRVGAPGARAALPVTLDRRGAAAGTRYFVDHVAVQQGRFGTVRSALRPWVQGATGTSFVFGSPASPGVMATTAAQGTTYAFAARATDRFGNTANGFSSPSTNGVTSSLRSVPVDQTRGVLGRGAVNAVRSGSFGGTSAVLPRAGATFAMAVKGQQLQLLGERCPTCGAVDVYVGTRRVARVDTYARSRAVRQVLWSRTFATDRASTVSLRAVGTPGRPSVVIDALDGRRWIGPGAAGLTAGSTIGIGTAFEIRAVAPGDVYQDARVVEGRLEVRRGPRSGPLRTIYASPRTAVPAQSLILQSDGNVVLRSADGRPVWSTGTSTPSGAYLMMQTDGNLVLYRATDGRALWSSRTGRLA